MRIALVTGASGFIGRNLCSLLLSRGTKVYAISRTGIDQTLLPRHELLVPVKQNVNDPIEIEFDTVFNLASPASHVENSLKPIETIRTNVLGTWNLLESARRNNASFFLASTSEVYGNPSVSPQHESLPGNSTTFGARSAYIEGKRLAETLVFEYQKEFGIETSVGRIFSAYGPGMQLDNGRVIPTLVKNALKNEPLVLFGDGSQVRSFTFISDLVEGIVELHASRKSTLGPVNLGSNEAISTLELALLIIEITGSKSNIEFAENTSESPDSLVPSILKMKSLTNWEAKTPLRQGLGVLVDALKIQMPKTSKH